MENFDVTKYIDALFDLFNALIASFAKPEEGEEKNIIDSIKLAIDTFLGTIKG